MGMCSGSSKQNKGLSQLLREKAITIFSKMDVDGSGSIDKQETLRYWKKNFAKLNSEALFQAVDYDKSGEITADEWLAFWEIVKKSGHTEEEIEEEMDGLLEGKAWVGFRKVDDFVKNDQKTHNKEVEKIVGKEHKKVATVVSKNLDEKPEAGLQNSTKSQAEESKQVQAQF